MAAADIVNRALELTAQNVRVSGSDPTFDGTTAGNAAGILYRPAVEMLLRQIDPDFARTRVALLSASGMVQPDPWTYNYAYPSDCLRLRQIAPLSGQYDKFDPLPIRGEVAYDSGGGKVILTNQAIAIAVYTTSLAGVGAENFWDPLFAEAVARRLANPLAMALAGRPDFARQLLEESEQFAQAAELSGDL